MSLGGGGGTPYLRGLKKKIDSANKTKTDCLIRPEGKQESVVLQKKREESASKGSDLLGEMFLKVR